MSDDQELDDKKRSFFTILAAAVMIDGELKPDELAELDALMIRTRTLSKLKEPARTQLREEVVPRLKNNFQSDMTRWDRIDLACQKLVELEPKESGICLSTFLHAVDLCHADRELVHSEEEFLNRIEKNLKIAAPAQARDLMKNKNAF